MGEIKVLNCDCNQFIETEEFKELADSGRLVIVTDPPFNVGYHYGRYKDRMKADEYYAMLKRILTKADCPFVVILYPESLHRLSIELGYSPNRVVSWVYNSNTAKQHRDIGFYGFSPDFRKVRQPYKNPNDKRIKERMAKGMGGGDSMTGGTSIKSRMCQRETIHTLVSCLWKSWTRLFDSFLMMPSSSILSVEVEQQDLLA